MKKTKALLDKLVEELEKTPLIQVACDKVGISRNTFYRWLKENKELLARVNEALSLGTGLVSDVALSNVLEGIKRKDAMYTKYWLSHKHPDFRRPYVFKVDSDDMISHFRSTMEGLRLHEIQESIRTIVTKDQKRKYEKDEKEVEKWIDGWKEIMENNQKIKAKKLLKSLGQEHENKDNKPRSKK
jgi:hypothetical protein